MAREFQRVEIRGSGVRMGENSGGTALLVGFLRAQTCGVRPGLRRGLVEVKLFWNS